MKLQTLGILILLILILLTAFLIRIQGTPHIPEGLLAVKIAAVVPKWPVVVSVSWMLGSVFFSMVMGVGFGLYPAMRAARLSPIDALRADT